jgi:hypothetical protein
MRPFGFGLARWEADSAQHGVVELLGGGEIVGTDHDVAEHWLLSFPYNPIRQTADQCTGPLSRSDCSSSVQLGAIGLGAADLLGEHLGAAGGRQFGLLRGQALTVRRYPAISVDRNGNPVSIRPRSLRLPKPAALALRVGRQWEDRK